MATIDELRGWKLAFERGQEMGRKWNKRKEPQPVNPYPIRSREATEWNKGFAKSREEKGDR